MKKSIVIGFIIFLLSVSSCYAQDLAMSGVMAGGGGSSAAAGGGDTCTTETFYGFQPEAGTSWDSSNSGYVMSNDGTNSKVTTPASSKRVCSLAIYSKSVTTVGYIRMAVLTTAGVPVCEGTALVGVPVDAGAWRGHTDKTLIKPFGGADGASCKLLANTDYIVSWFISDNSVYNLYAATANNQKDNHIVDYDAGFPNPTTWPNNYASRHYFRIGVSDD